MTRTAKLLLAVTCLWLCLFQGAAGQNEFQDDPAAHALYDSMIAALRSANSLCYESEYRCEAQGREIGHATYQVWLLISRNCMRHTRTKD